MFSPELKKGSIELLILSLLEVEDHHGYGLGKLIESRSGGNLQFNISSLYPVLCRMENRGWITGRWVEKSGQKRKKYYRLTRKGARAFAAQQRNWLAYTESVNRVLGLNEV